MEIRLQRSTTSFRRQGSSGLIWDDKFLSGELNQMKLNTQENRGSDHGMMMRRSGSERGNGHMHRTVRAASPIMDPPSPKVSGCGFCGVLGKPAAGKKRRSNKRKSSSYV